MATICASLPKVSNSVADPTDLGHCRREGNENKRGSLVIEAMLYEVTRGDIFRQVFRLLEPARWRIDNDDAGVGLDGLEDRGGAVAREQVRGEDALVRSWSDTSVPSLSR